LLAADRSASDTLARIGRVRRNRPSARISLLLTTIVILGACSPEVERVDPPASPISHDVALKRILNATEVPGGVLLVRRGKQITMAATGVAQKSPHEPMQADLRFRIGSITKTFVATVVLQLAAEHDLSLDDTVDHWLPGLVPRGKRITVRMLLNHTSGIPEYMLYEPNIDVYAKDRAYYWSPRELIQSAWSASPVSPPGDFSYSNTNYLLLGEIVKKATGNGIGLEIAERIVRPLELEDTLFPTGPNVPGPHAHGYTRQYPFLTTSGKPVDTTVMSPSISGAAGAMISNAADLDRFLRALVSGDLLPPASLRAMKPTSGSRDGGYGLGLGRAGLDCGSMLGHNGDVFGYTSVAMVSDDGNQGLVLLLNGPVPSPEAWRTTDRTINELLCDAQND
jgi:D-alanyl-D-alanine carboxypeptidase